MKKALLSMATLLSFLMLYHVSAFAIPRLISYQGMLNDANGLPISSTVGVTFSIYNAETGGVALWSETQSVPVSNGLFNVKLGSITPLLPSLFDQDSLYLGIQVGSDPEMLPRQQITSGSFVNKAAHADKAAELDKIIVPIGSIIAWVKSMAGIPPLPDGWVECNGQTLSDPESPLSGEVMPNLNGEGRFLRGSTSSGGKGGSTQHRHAKGVASPSNFNTYGGANTVTDYQNHLPPYFNVVWIMKIK